MYKNIWCGIYCIKNKITNKVYIGQSKNIKSRWRKHKSELKNGTHDNDYLQMAWDKYGENNFIFRVLELCDENDLDEKECYYIKYYDATNKDYGYNLKDGGQHGKMTEYSRKKLSEAIKHSFEGPERRKKSIESAYKQWQNPEIKQKIMGKNNGMYGKHHTEEAKEKISKARTGTISPFRDKHKVLCVELNKIFEDAVTAAKELGTQSGGILQVCRGERKTCCGYKWKFVNGE